MEYHAAGGSFPIHLQDNSIVGSVTVSGLTPELDHEYAVKGIKLFLNK